MVHPLSPIFPFFPKFTVPASPNILMWCPIPLFAIPSISRIDNQSNFTAQVAAYPKSTYRFPKGKVEVAIVARALTATTAKLVIYR